MASEPLITDSGAVETRLRSGTPVALPDPLAPTRAQRLFEGRAWTVLRLAMDMLALTVATALAGVGLDDVDFGEPGYVTTLAFAPLVLLILSTRGLYEQGAPGGRSGVLDGLRHLVSSTSLAAVITIAATELIAPGFNSGELVVAAWALATGIIAAERGALSMTRRVARASRISAKPTLIIGAGKVSALLEARLREQPDLGLLPVGYLDADPVPDEHAPGRTAPILGAPDQLRETIEATGAKHVIFSFLSSPDSVLRPLIRECEEMGVEVSVVPRLFESTNMRIELEHIGALPLFRLKRIDPKGWQFAVKHVFGRIVAAVFLLLVAPLFIGAAIAVKVTSRGPVFFRQRRVGRDGQEFEMLKFRTMLGDPDDSGQFNSQWVAESVGISPAAMDAPDDRRTPVGAFLRRYSIDELPQLLNVLKGHMSLVGPRPELPDYVRMFGKSVYRYDDRHRVKSGLTGWAQVNGLRGNTSLADRIQWDNYYIENWSLWLDFKILILTVLTVLKPAE